MNCKEMISYFHPTQLEQKYGGEAPNLEAPYWPPRMPEFVVDDIVSKKLVPEENYDKFLEDHPAFTRRPDVSNSE